MPQVKKTSANIKKCICPACPSYNKCAGGNKEALYCAKEIGKSSCEYKMNGCICGGCPVHTENKLNSGYYCINGATN